jgi:hypothetical protein
LLIDWIQMASFGGVGAGLAVELAHIFAAGIDAG